MRNINAVLGACPLFSSSHKLNVSVIAAAVAAGMSLPAAAFQFDTGTEVQARWDLSLIHISEPTRPY